MDNDKIDWAKAEKYAVKLSVAAKIPIFSEKFFQLKAALPAIISEIECAALADKAIKGEK